MAEVSVRFDRENLLNEELDLRYGQLTLAVVDVDHGFGHLLWGVDVFLVGGPHSGLALIDAAPGRDLRLLMLVLVHPKLNLLLTNHQHLLVLHLVAVVVRVQGRLYVVLSLGLWVLTLAFVLEVHAGGHIWRQLESKGHLVGSRVEPAAVLASDLEHGDLDVGELVLVLDAFGALTELFTVLLLPETRKRRLFLAFDLHFYEAGGQGLKHINEDFTLDSVAGLIEGELSLNLETALGEIASGVREVEHSV